MKPEILEALAQFNESVVTYRCGECDYLESDRWKVHQAHYKAHREEQ